MSITKPKTALKRSLSKRSKKLPSKQKLHSAYTTTTYNRTSLAKRVP